MTFDEFMTNGYCVIRVELECYPYIVHLLFYRFSPEGRPRALLGYGN